MTEIAASAIKQWAEHPALMVAQLFDVTPDKWQEDVLEAFPHHQRLQHQATAHSARYLKFLSRIHPMICVERSTRTWSMRP